MAKSYAKLSHDLVIVESPAKCKKIESYLGSGYKCIASFGHLRELASLENVNIAKGFDILYTPIDDAIKKNQIKLIGNAVASAVASGGQVILATDDDREGEAIAWHICMLFDLNVEKTKRIIFHEITEKAIQDAVKSPIKVNMNIVRAQQARQILDIIVGFKISPILWKYITSSNLSAGRCQTPALKLVYDNHQDILKNPGTLQYNTIGYFTQLCIPFELNKHHRGGMGLGLGSDEDDDVTDFLFESAEFSHRLKCGPPKKVEKPPPQPLNTSRVQQAASNELHISPKDTMRLCQTLYEGGYITYMRTDSRTVSDEFLKQATKYIADKWNKDYVGQADTLPLKKKEDSDPHEAIRPTSISMSELPEKEMDSKVRRLYKLIWQTTLESCMAPARFFSIKAEISAPSSKDGKDGKGGKNGKNGKDGNDGKNKYTYLSELLDFHGWMAVENKKSDISREKIHHFLSSFSQKPDDLVSFTKICSTVHMKEQKQHYTEARLVQLLEELGIGRPSTFSSLVEKIQERGYVKKCDVKGKEFECTDYELENGDVCEIMKKREFGNEKAKLVLQPLGIMVLEFLVKHFSSLFQYDYTKNMEDLLDKIAMSGKIESETDWKDLCKSCLSEVESLICSVERSGENKKVEYKIDAEHNYIIGRYGPVIKCTKGKNVSFKSLRKDIEIDVQKLERGEYSLEDLLDKTQQSNRNFDRNTNTNTDASTKWEYKDQPLTIKKGKFGLYAAWGKNTKSLKSLGNRPIENITYDEVVALL